MIGSIAHFGQTVTYRAVSLAWLMVACEGDVNPPVTTEVDTIGGVVVVWNGTGLWHESEQWQVVQEFRVGNLWGGNPDQELRSSRNNSVTLGPNGQIYVLEYATDRVMVFSGDGEFVKSFGGSGEGPGELRGPVAMTWDEEHRLWVAEGQGRYSVFDSNGSFQKTVRRITRPFKRLQRPLVWEAGGTLIEEAGDGDAEVVLYLRVDTLGNFVDTVAVIPTPNPDFSHPQESTGLRGMLSLCRP